MKSNRLLICFSGAYLMHIIGTVYGWSVFKIPLIESHGWQSYQVNLSFTLVILFSGITMALCGRFFDKLDTRIVCTLAALIFGSGHIIAGLANTYSILPLLWIGYGLSGGIGLGFIAVTVPPILMRWYPEKKGVVSGFAFMSMGFGGAVLGQLAPFLINAWGISNTFYAIGVFFLITMVIPALQMLNPQSIKTDDPEKETPTELSISVGSAIRMKQFYLLWLSLLVSVTVGLALISNLSPLAQSQLGLTSLAAGSIVFFSSLFNGFGRLFWAFISDKIGQKNVFLIMFLTQIPVLILLINSHNRIMFTLLCCYLFSCYGGAFPTMLSFLAETFGLKYLIGIYGIILTAYGIGAVVGPMVIELVEAQFGSLFLAIVFLILTLMVGVGGIGIYKKPVVYR